MPILMGAGATGFPLAYIVINIDPILFTLGPIAVHWYGLAYVVAIGVGMWLMLRWTRRQGIHDDQVWSLFIWAALAGLIGARLYFVIQQPDLVQNYLLNPLNIIAVWKGGLAFFGAIFGGTAALFFLGPRYGIDKFLIIDGGALFAAVGQIFGRFGNIVNGDILGLQASTGTVHVPATVCAHAPCVAYVADPTIIPWAFVYTNAASFAQTFVAFHPAPIYEMITNLVALAILWPLRFALPRFRPGVLFIFYLAIYGLGQFIVFFFRGTEPITPFLGVTSFKQAQWTGIAVILAAIPLLFLVLRFSRPWPFSAAKPVPWPLPTGGLDAARAEALDARNTSGARVASPADKPLPAPPTQAIDVPPWEPYRPLNGELRNQLGRPAPSANS